MNANSKFQSWSLTWLSLLTLAALLLPGRILADDSASAQSQTTNFGPAAQSRSLNPEAERPKRLEKQRLEKRRLETGGREETQELKTRTPSASGPNTNKTQRAEADETKNQNQQKAFCKQLESEKNNLTGLANEHKDKLLENRDSRVEALKDRLEKRGERIDDRRQTFDDRREAQFKKLADRAQTDAQTQAVNAFRNTLETAVQAKRSAIDAARLAYQQGLQTLIENRGASLKTATETLRAQTESAFAQAQTDCAANLDVKTIRENLKTAVKTAREQFQGQRQNLKTYQEQIKNLRDTRDQAFKKAVSDFQAAIEKAKNDLKAALQTQS